MITDFLILILWIQKKSYNRNSL